MIKKWEERFSDDKKNLRYFRELKKLVKEVITLSKEMKEKRSKKFIDRKADLIGRLRRKLKRELPHPQAGAFIKKLSGRIEELICCLDFEEVCSHNNWAERLLRGNVIMRKVSFGNRSDEELKNHEILMSLSETARLNDHDPLTLLRDLLTNPGAAAATFIKPPALRGVSDLHFPR